MSFFILFNMKQKPHNSLWFPQCCHFKVTGELYSNVFHNIMHFLVKNTIASFQIVQNFKLSHSVQFSPSVPSDTLLPHGLQHARLPCLSPTPGACSDSCPSSWWCHPTILSFVVPFSSCLKSFPALESFPMSQFFALGGQSIGASASASVLAMNI